MNSVREILHFTLFPTNVRLAVPLIGLAYVKILHLIYGINIISVNACTRPQPFSEISFEFENWLSTTNEAH